MVGVGRDGGDVRYEGDPEEVRHRGRYAPKTDANRCLHGVAHLRTLTDTFSSPTSNNFCHDADGQVRFVTSTAGLRAALGKVSGRRSFRIDSRRSLGCGWRGAVDHASVDVIQLVADR